MRKKPKESEKDINSSDVNPKVTWEKYDEESLRERVLKFETDEKIVGQIVKRSRQILKHRDNTRFEDLSYIDSTTGYSRTSSHYDYFDGVYSRCKPNKWMKKMLKKAPKRSIISIHNHPASTTPSADDVFAAKKYKYGLVFGHDGKIFKYTTDENASLNEYNFPFVQSHLDLLQKTLYTEDAKKEIHALAGYGINVEVY